MRAALCMSLVVAGSSLQVPRRPVVAGGRQAVRCAAGGASSPEASPGASPAGFGCGAGRLGFGGRVGRSVAGLRGLRPSVVAPARASVTLSEEKRGMSRVPSLVAFLGLWYGFNAFFNVQNKKILNQFAYPWVVSWFQLASGLLFVFPMWFSKLRSAPIVDRSLVLKFLPIAALHCGGHGLQVSSMGAGSVFFTHVIKATEPVIGMLVLLVFTGKIAPWWVNACLSPIVGGVAYAALKPGTAFDLSDLLGYASVAALASTVAFSIAKLLAKSLMGGDTKKKHNLTAANNYAFLTICSTCLLLVPSAFGEGPAALAAFKELPDQAAFVRQLLGCGFLYYGYNEMGFRVLDLLSPVSAAVANSLKRVAVLFAAVLFLGETVSTRKIVGSSIAMAGVLLYSLAKAKAAKLPPKPVEIVVDVEESGSWQP